MPTKPTLKEWGQSPEICTRILSGDGEAEMMIPFFTENETEGSQRRLKGFSKLTMMAAAVDPRIKMLKENPDTDKRLLWHHK